MRGSERAEKMDSRKCGTADTSDGNDSFGYIQSHRDKKAGRQKKKRKN